MTLKEIAALAVAEDADNSASLAAHDRRFHPEGFKEGDNCKFRDELEKGDENDSIASASKSPKLPKGISVEIADITKQPVDAIVNAANRWMLGGGGVDGAIHRAAGPSLVKECEKYPPDEHGYRVQTGEAKITGAGDLPAKHVIHTAGPDVREFATIPKDGPLDGFGLFAGMIDLGTISADGWKELDRLLGNSYRNSMELAAENGAKSIAFPSISTGIFGFPVDRAAGIAAKEISAFREKHPDVSVKMCVFDPNPDKAQEIKSAYETAFADEMIPTEDADDATEQTSQPPANPAQMTDLQKHDAKYHPKGYKKGDKCKYRENMAKGDNADLLDPENVDGDTDSGKPHTIYSAGPGGSVMISAQYDPNASDSTIIGFSGKEEADAVKRITAACSNAGMPLSGNFTADVSGDGKIGNPDAYDLPIVLALTADDNDKEWIWEYSSLGRLSLGGLVAKPHGVDVLNAAKEARRIGRRGLLVPPEAANEASLINGIDVFPVRSVAEARGFLEGKIQLNPATAYSLTAQDLNAMLGDRGLTADVVSVNNGIVTMKDGRRINLFDFAKELEKKPTPKGDSNSPVAALQTKVGALMGFLGKLKDPNGLTAELVKRTVGKTLGLDTPAAKPKAKEEPPAKQRKNPDIPETLEDALEEIGITPANFTKQSDPAPQGANVYLGDSIAQEEQTAMDIANSLAKELPKGWETCVFKKPNGKYSVHAADKGVLSGNGIYEAVFEGGTGNLLTSKSASSSTQFGPRPSLTNDESDFPDDADFDFGNYGKTSSGYHSAGSGSTNPHWIDINGQRYYVKQAGNNPTYNNDAAQNEVNANKFLRMAGLLAPESKLYTENGVNYCVTKALPHSGNLATGNLSDPSVKKQLEEAYPVMDLMYNTDILQNDNAYIDKNGDIAFIDNGSSFGTSAQGTRNSKKKFGFDYDHRSDPYSGDANEDYGALSRHSSQAAWKQIAAGTDINEQAAKWKLGWLAKEAIKQGLVPKQAQSAFQQFADAIDNYSDKKFPNLRPGKARAVSSATASSPASANTAPSATPQSSSSQGGTTSISQAQSASATPQPQHTPNPNAPLMPSGTKLFNAMIQASPTWTPNLNTRQSRNATGFLNAVASLPKSAVAGKLGSMQKQANNALAAMIRATFTANKIGVGGVVTGANIPRKGVQALGKYLNQILNPQGYKIQIHNNGNVTISQSNRGIANAAMQAAGASAPTTSSNASFSNNAWAQGIPAAKGSTKHANIQVSPNVPASLTQGLTANGSILGPNYTYTVTPTSSGGYVLGLSPGQNPISLNAGGRLLQNAPTVAGYNKSLGSNGVVYTPVPSAPATPQSPAPSATPAASAATPASATPAAAPSPSPAPSTQPASSGPGWQTTLSNLQQNPKSKSLGNAYNAVANWLNNANQSAASNQ